MERERERGDREREKKKKMEEKLKKGGKWKIEKSQPRGFLFFFFFFFFLFLFFYFFYFYFFLLFFFVSCFLCQCVGVQDSSNFEIIMRTAFLLRSRTSSGSVSAIVEAYSVMTPTISVGDPPFTLSCRMTCSRI